MKQNNFYLSRRVFLTAGFSAGLVGGSGHALAQTLKVADVIVLNVPAIKVASFQRVFLIAVTLAGNRLVAVGQHGVIIYSDNDGVNWRQAQVLVDVSLTCVAFATPKIGWAAGHYGVVLNTQDGGESWTMQLNGIEVNQLALAAAVAADSAARAKPASNPSPAVELALKRATLFSANGPDKPFLTMLVFSPKKLVVFGAYRMVVMSDDGGKTWVDWSLHIYDRLSHDLYDAAVIGSDIYVVAEAGLVFRSSDGGETFQQIALQNAITMFGVVGARDGSVLVFGVAGNCLRSTDGGSSWTAIELGTQDDLVAGRLLPSGTVLIARGAGGLYISRDNGASFTAVPNFPGMSIADFDIAPDGALIVVGGGGPQRLALTGLS